MLLRYEMKTLQMQANTRKVDHDNTTVIGDLRTTENDDAAPPDGGLRA